MDKAAQTLDQNQAFDLHQPGRRQDLGRGPLARLLPAAADDGREQEPRERRLVRLRAAGLHEDRLPEQPELIGPGEATERRAAGRRGLRDRDLAGPAAHDVRPVRVGQRERRQQGAGPRTARSPASMPPTSAARARCRFVRAPLRARRPAPSSSSTTGGSSPRPRSWHQSTSSFGPSTLDDLGVVAVARGARRAPGCCSGVTTSACGRPRWARNPSGWISIAPSHSTTPAISRRAAAPGGRSSTLGCSACRPQTQSCSGAVLGCDGARRLEPRAARRATACAVRPGEALLAGRADHHPRAQAVERPGDEGSVGHGRAATGVGGGAGAGTDTWAGRATTSTRMRREGP